MVKLTETTVLTRTRQNSLAAVRHLNLWGNDLTDVSVVERMPNIEVLSLSVNRIDSLRYFANCSQLRELYLRKNDIRELGEVACLAPLSALRILWLGENPCMEAAGARSFVLGHLPQLTKLDDRDVTEEERLLAFSAHERAPESFERRDRSSPEPPIESQPRSAFQSAAQSGGDPPRARASSRPPTAAGPLGPLGSQEPSAGTRRATLPARPRDEPPGPASPDARELEAEPAAPRRAPSLAQAPQAPAVDSHLSGERKGPSSQGSVHGGARSQHNIMVALLALLDELEPHNLRWIRAEVDRRVGKGGPVNVGRQGTPSAGDPQ